MLGTFGNNCNALFHCHFEYGSSQITSRGFPCAVRINDEVNVSNWERTFLVDYRPTGEDHSDHPVHCVQAKQRTLQSLSVLTITIFQNRFC